MITESASQSVFDAMHRRNAALLKAMADDVDPRDCLCKYQKCDAGCVCGCHISSTERTIEDAQRMHLIPPQPLRVVCAWCPDFIPTDEPNVTHGMCPACAEKMK